jgi:signal recognition particle GTPase
MHIPVRFIGVGEKMEHLQDFVVAEFIDSLLPESLADGLASGEDASEENGAK